jgi:hypothetical protein
MVLGALVCTLALLGMSRFVLETVQGVRARRALLRGARCSETRTVGLRSVRVYVSQLIPIHRHVCLNEHVRS